MAAAVLTEGNARVGHAQLDVQVGIADAVAHLVISAARAENGKGADEGSVSDGSETGGQAHHVSFGDAGVEEPIRELFGKGRSHGGVREVGVEDDDLIVGFT